MIRLERPIVIAALVLHAALAVWGAARNSVTFDEGFHLSSGYLIVTRGEFRLSAVNPPLVKALCAASALFAGARPPTPEALANGEQGVVAESFMRQNADRFHRVFFAARMGVVLISVVLAWFVWRFARRLFGPLGALLALGFYALAPEALAHGGLVTMDVATGLGWVATMYAFQGFVSTGRWGGWWATAAALAFAFLVRFTALLLGPVLLALWLVALMRRRVRHPRRVAIGLVLLPLTTVIALDTAYLGKVSLTPLRNWQFESATFHKLQEQAPWLRLPLPSAYVAGLDRQSVETSAGNTPAYLLGRVLDHAVWYYFPLAFAAKLPLGFLAALALAAFRRAGPARRSREAIVLVPAAVLFAIAMFVYRLDIGIRYLFPVIPLACIWLGGLGRMGGKRSAGILRLAPALSVALLITVAVEVAFAAPWYLAFFNRAAGGAGRGDRIVNDSNVDWGQGLIALREEMRRRGIPRVHLAYHGMVDPAVYGIEYVPYLGGKPGPESDWIAVSSYYFVGLSQRMMTREGRTAPVTLDFRALWNTAPAARPAGCMYLFRVR